MQVQFSFTRMLGYIILQTVIDLVAMGRVLTVHGSDDEVIPVEDAKEFAKIIPNHKLEIVEGADHCYTKHQSQLVAIVTEFVKTVIVKHS